MLACYFQLELTWQIFSFASLLTKLFSDWEYKILVRNIGYIHIIFFVQIIRQILHTKMQNMLELVFYYLWDETWCYVFLFCFGFPSLLKFCTPVFNLGPFLLLPPLDRQMYIDPNWLFLVLLNQTYPRCEDIENHSEGLIWIKLGFCTSAEVLKFPWVAGNAHSCLMMDSNELFILKLVWCTSSIAKNSR